MFEWINKTGVHELQLLKRDMKICEKLAESLGFMSDYCTVPIGIKTDVLASEFLKMPSSELTTPNPIPKR